MRRYYLILLIFLSLTSQLLPQGWFQQNINTIDDLLCVFFIDTLNGWVGSNMGKIYKTTDGGETWNAFLTNSNKDIVSIHFINSDIGWCGFGVSTLEEGIYITKGGCEFISKPQKELILICS